MAHGVGLSSGTGDEDGVVARRWRGAGRGDARGGPCRTARSVTDPGDSSTCRPRRLSAEPLGRRRPSGRGGDGQP
ncbi:hypothetical protein B005_0172 [Nocardiopsis alba ATCC BAA-2165]|uniref:Uncharacterized protein n=1 Tax=Nocardiopsis alba (strain ATCC BAA-2165 / BE74) TaxID=1205910 RepID=J7L554_NOCAA|nr:hypothetical protein B005_0172 [Nocardiopsis alba ATCC BAA-2165]